MRRRRIRTCPGFFALAVCSAVVVAGCELPDSLQRLLGTRVENRCEPPRVLPGSVPLSSNISADIAAAGIPAEARRTGRHVCNRMALEPAPFTRQRALDPIDWRRWSAETLAEAERLRRPLLVLTGFSTSDDCAALAARELSRRSLARRINAGFVPVLVDRDERPDVDAYLMLATEVMTGGGGWPAVVFLHADARPFEAYSWGAASTVAAGRKQRKLGAIAGEVRRRIALGGGTLEERAALASEKMQRRVDNDTSGDLPDAARAAAALRGYLFDSYDADSASFGSPPLFPRAPVLDFLLDLHAQKEDAAALAMAVDVLVKLHQSELADRAGGGWHRYARAEGWKQPAREKLLADNAALARTLLDAFRASGRDELAGAARATLEFLLRDLALPGGAFAAGVPAETEGRAGRDATVLADANAVAITTFVRAADVLGEPRYAAAALSAARFLDEQLRDGARVKHCMHAGGRLCRDGYLGDHALVALAFLDVAQVAGGESRRFVDAARVIAVALPERFEHAPGGGYFQTANDAETLPLRMKPYADAAIASGNSAAALLLTRIAARTGSAHDVNVARRAFEAFAEVLSLRPLAVPAMVTALGELSRLPAPHDPTGASGARAFEDPQAHAPVESVSSAPPQLDPAPAVHP